MPLISIIVPAYNEEIYLPSTLQQLRLALNEFSDAEVIIVDNSSTDATRSIAAAFGAVVVDESVHNISRVRNAGAKTAQGDVFVFLDADTHVRPGVFNAITEAMNDRHCFGGSVRVQYLRSERLWVRLYLKVWTIAGRLTKMHQGAAQFCRREPFVELGGYDESIYVGEDIEFQWRLKRLARASGGYTTFVEEPKVLTSARRFSKMGVLRTLFLTHPVTIFLLWRFEPVWKDWYERSVR